MKPFFHTCILLLSGAWFVSVAYLVYGVALVIVDFSLVHLVASLLIVTFTTLTTVVLSALYG